MLAIVGILLIIAPFVGTSALSLKNSMMERRHKTRWSEPDETPSFSRLVNSKAFTPEYDMLEFGLVEKHQTKHSKHERLSTHYNSRLHRVEEAYMRWKRLYSAYAARKLTEPAEGYREMCIRMGIRLPQLMFDMAFYAPHSFSVQEIAKTFHEAVSFTQVRYELARHVFERLKSFMDKRGLDSASLEMA
jgi:hypothetical protein